VVLTIASLLIVGEALARTGVASQIGEWITRIAGTSETKTPFLLMAPVAVSIAGAMDVSPQPFAMAVAIAASSAYISPISSPVGTLVMEPGGYRYLDFVKAGVPLLILTWIVAMAIIPVFFKF